MDTINKILAHLYQWLGGKPKSTIVRLHEHDGKTHAMLLSLQANGNSSPVIIGMVVNEMNDDECLAYYVSVQVAKSLSDLILHEDSIEETDVVTNDEQIGALMDTFLKENHIMDWLKERMYGTY